MDNSSIEFAQKLAIEIARAYDPFTAYHMDTTSILARDIALRVKDHFGLQDEEIEYIRIFAGLHDIGKISIPEEILYKETPLTTVDRTLIETHPLIGKSIVDGVIRNNSISGDYEKFLPILYDMVYHHHERLDGSGYPHGLRGEEVSAYTRIIAVADCFDAMSSHRSYRKVLPIEDTLKEIEKMVKKGELDEKCFEALVEIVTDTKLD